MFRSVKAAIRYPYSMFALRSSASSLTKALLQLPLSHREPPPGKARVMIDRALRWAPPGPFRAVAYPGPFATRTSTSRETDACKQFACLLACTHAFSYLCLYTHLYHQRSTRQSSRQDGSTGPLGTRHLGQRDGLHRDAGQRNLARRARALAACARHLVGRKRLA